MKTFRSILLETVSPTWDEKLHPRVKAGSSEGGQFTDKDEQQKSYWASFIRRHLQQKKAVLALPPPKVMDVKGDEWNKATARRLEQEYQSIKPKIDEIMEDAIGSSAYSGGPVSKDWDDLSSSQQDEVYERWKEDNWDAYYNGEVQSWHDTHDAMNDAKWQVKHEYDNFWPDVDWLNELLTNLIEEHNIPYSLLQLKQAIEIDYDTSDGDSDCEVTFDDSALKNPTNVDFDPEKQGDFIGQLDLSTHLTKEMRDVLTEEITYAFEKEAQDLLDRDMIEVPSYLNDSTAEVMEIYWNDKYDTEKMEIAKKYLDDLNSDDDYDNRIIDDLPKRYDPLNKTSGMDYRRTQAISHFIFMRRAEQILKERFPGSHTNFKSYTQNFDSQIWDAWKSSSTTDLGMALQVASAEEFGGRLNTELGSNGKAIDIDFIKKLIDERHPLGFEGMKALVRAKWETTQWLMESAGLDSVDVYRSIGTILDQDDLEGGFTYKAPLRKYVKITNAKIARNGCASTTISSDVANGWNIYDQVVLRIHAPRTAVLSVPCFGQNVHSEQELVVLGTAWKDWDAFKGTAPRAEEWPIGANFPVTHVPPNTDAVYKTSPEDKAKNEAADNKILDDIYGQETSKLIGKYTEWGANEWIKMKKLNPGLYDALLINYPIQKSLDPNYDYKALTIEEHKKLANYHAWTKQDWEDLKQNNHALWAKIEWIQKHHFGKSVDHIKKFFDDYLTNIEKDNVQ